MRSATIQEITVVVSLTEMCDKIIILWWTGQLILLSYPFLCDLSSLLVDYLILLMDKTPWMMNTVNTLTLSWNVPVLIGKQLITLGEILKGALLSIFEWELTVVRVVRRKPASLQGRLPLYKWDCFKYKSHISIKKLGQKLPFPICAFISFHTTKLIRTCRMTCRLASYRLASSGLRLTKTDCVNLGPTL